MDINNTQTQAEILGALRQIQDNPELQAEARTNPEGLVSRFHLSTIARHAVTLAITGAAILPAATTHITVRPNSFW